jgi:protein-disulfide isomerase
MLENQAQPEQKGSKTKWVALTIGGCLVIIACFALASTLVVRFYGTQIGDIFSQVGLGLNGTPKVPQGTTTSHQNPESKFNTMGDPNAPVKIIEYADFQCPYCMRYWQETEPQIIKTYVTSGKVYYEYRSMGAFIGPESGSAAAAAYCAGDQGKFWEYHDALYSHWTGENTGDFAPAKLHQYGVTIGLDTKTFDEWRAPAIHIAGVGNGGLTPPCLKRHPHS